MAANTGMLTIDFKSFAESIKITEGELAYLLEHEQVYKGSAWKTEIFLR